MNSIWRFYLDQQGGWRWQQMSISIGVIAESSSASPTYDDCLASAQPCGYRYERSQPALPRYRGTFSIVRSEPKETRAPSEPTANGISSF